VKFSLVCCVEYSFYVMEIINDRDLSFNLFKCAIIVIQFS